MHLRELGSAFMQLFARSGIASGLAKIGEENRDTSFDRGYNYSSSGSRTEITLTFSLVLISVFISRASTSWKECIKTFEIMAETPK
jgi:hypothetical protein